MRPRRHLNHMDWDLGDTELEKQRTKGAAGGLTLPFLFDSRSDCRLGVRNGLDWQLNF